MPYWMPSLWIDFTMNPNDLASVIPGLAASEAPTSYNA